MAGIYEYQKETGEQMKDYIFLNCEEIKDGYKDINFTAGYY